jgi:heptosyltransferase-3
MSPEIRQTFLVSRTDAIGDVVLTLPVCGQLKQLFPGCWVVLIGRTYTAPVAAACPWVDDFLNLDELARLPGATQVATLRSYAAHAIIHVFPNTLLARLAHKARIPVRIGTRNRWRHWLTCNRLVALSRRHSTLHEAQLNLKLLQPFGLNRFPPLPEVAQLVRLQATEPLAEQWQQLLEARQPGQLNVILHPRSRGSAREWGLDNFARLAQLLHRAATASSSPALRRKGRSWPIGSTKTPLSSPPTSPGSLACRSSWPSLPPPMAWWQAAPARCTWRRH